MSEIEGDAMCNRINFYLKTIFKNLAVLIKDDPNYTPFREFEIGDRVEIFNWLNNRWEGDYLIYLTITPWEDEYYDYLKAYNTERMDNKYYLTEINSKLSLVWSKEYLRLRGDL